MNPVKEYWQAIETGAVTVSARVKKQYQKLVHEIDNPGRYRYDDDRANRPIEFIEKFCRHSKGEWAGKPVTLELFQRAYIAALFGFVDATTGLRRYRETMFFVARKNGKTTMLAGIALYMLIADGEGGAEVYSTATKHDQARILFDEAHNMVKQSPYLAKHLRKRKTDLYFPATMSKMQPLGKNSNSLDGLNAHLVIMDELHGVRDRNLYEVMKQSQSARRQPLLIMITTAGTVRESIFDDMYEYACNVVDGTFEDDTFLPVLYELDEREEWTEPDTWPKANPGLGVMKKQDDLEQKVKRAQHNAAEVSGVLTKDFNVRDTATSAWLPFDAIDNRATFEIDTFRNSYAIGGADLSVTTDTTAAGLLMVDQKTEQRYFHVMYWMPAKDFDERVRRDKIPWDIWRDRGLLRLCSGNTINYRDVTQWYLEMLGQHGITPLWVYYDSYSARYWVDEMEQHGFKMVRCIQGAKTLSLPMQHLGADLRAGRVTYNNNPVLKWNLTNVGIETDRNGNIVPVKAQQAKMRIDGVSALLNSYVGLMEHYEEFLRAL